MNTQQEDIKQIDGVTPQPDYPQGAGHPASE